MDAARVTTECDVVGELVDLIAERETSVPPWLQR
jgi:hypothetical protein